MATKCITDYKIALRPDIKYYVRKETSFWSGKVKMDWFFSVGKLGDKWSSYSVCMGWYNEEENLNMCRFFWLLDSTKHQFFKINRLRELDRSYKLKRILRLMDGYSFRPEYPAPQHVVIYAFDSNDDNSIRKYTLIQENQTFNANFTAEWNMYQPTSWSWRTNKEDYDNSGTLTHDEFYFVKYCIALSFLQNMNWWPTSNHRDYFIFKYNENCIERAISLGWIK